MRTGKCIVKNFEYIGKGVIYDIFLLGRHYSTPVFIEPLNFSYILRKFLWQSGQKDLLQNIVRNIQNT